MISSTVPNLNSPTLTWPNKPKYDPQAAETKALALGAVNSNLLELKRRINSTLTDMLTVTATLETARQRLDRKQAEAVRCCFDHVRTHQEAIIWKAGICTVPASTLKNLILHCAAKGC